MENADFQAKPGDTVNSHANGWSGQLLLLRKSFKTHGRIRAVYLVWWLNQISLYTSCKTLYEP